MFLLTFWKLLLFSLRNERFIFTQRKSLTSEKPCCFDTSFSTWCSNYCFSGITSCAKQTFHASLCILQVWSNLPLHTYLSLRMRTCGSVYADNMVLFFLFYFWCEEMSNQELSCESPPATLGLGSGNLWEVHVFTSLHQTQKWHCFLLSISPSAQTPSEPEWPSPPAILSPGRRFFPSYRYAFKLFSIWQITESIVLTWENNLLK